MKKSIIRKLKIWIIQYARSISEKDTSIRNHVTMKLLHSFYVRRHIISIGKSLGLCEKDLVIAEATGLFHDLGRFEQYLKYRTFNDRLSIDHAAHSKTLLKKYNLLDFMDRADQDLILTAIHHHNHSELPSELAPREELFCKLIRDADKLDIFRLVSGHMLNETAIPQIAGSSSNESISQPIHEAFERRKSADIYLSKSTMDIYAVRLSWIFDINFVPTLIFLKQKRYLENMRMDFPQSKTMAGFYDIIRSHIENRIKKGSMPFP